MPTKTQPKTKLPKWATREFYPAPVDIYEDVVETIQAWRVWPGMEVSGRKVATKKAGTKWIVFRDADDNLIKRVELDSMVTVKRRKLTEASARAEHRHEANMTLVRELEKGIPQDLEDAVRKLSKTVIDKGYLPSYTDIGDILEAASRRKVLAQWFQAVEFQASPECKDRHDGDLLDFHRAYVAELTKASVMYAHQHRAISRSTNMVSNLMDDCDMEATVQFINRHWGF